MPAYNVQGAPAIGRLPGLPAKRNIINTTINQYFSTMAAEKVVIPANNNQLTSFGDGNYFWATGRVMNIDNLGLAYWYNGSQYLVQPFTYGNNAAQMVGTPITVQFTSGAFGHPLRLWDGSILMSNRGSYGQFCRITVNPATYAITQDTAFLTIPTSGTCVSGEAFTCTPTTNEFGYTFDPVIHPQWFVDAAELVIFGTITIAAASWVAAFVFNQAGQLTRVHKIATYTRQTNSYTYLHVRKVNSYYHVVVQNRYYSTGYLTYGRYFSCSTDFSDITAFSPEKNWNGGSLYKFIMAADSKAVVIMLCNTASPPAIDSNLSVVYRLDSKGKPISTSANNTMPAGMNLGGLLPDLLGNTSYSSDVDAFTRLPNYASTSSLSAVPAQAGYLAVSTNHSYSDVSQADVYKGGYKFATLSDANGDLLMRFYPRVVVNQVDDSTTYGSYSAVKELCELSGGYWLGLQQTAGSSFSLRLYKEQV